MKSYYCTSCGRHLFKFEVTDGRFCLLLKCHSCKTMNSVSVGSYILTSTTFSIEVAEANEIVQGYLQEK